jgi:hypothetical protein
MRRGFGFLAVHARSIHAEPDVAARIAELLVDPRWPWPMHLVRPSQTPRAPVYPWPSGKVPSAKLPSTVLDILRADNTLGIHLVASRKDELNHVFAHIFAGHADYTGQPESTRYPFEAKLFCRAEQLPAGARLDAWVELLHELVVLLDTPHAVIMTRDDERHIWSLLYGLGSAAADKPADHPHNVSARVNAGRREIGAARIRPPEWGTYLSPSHVDQIGRDKLVAAAAVSREVGKLLYLQCSERAADALGPEALERRQAIARLLAPISV